MLRNPIELLDDVCHMESCFGVLGDSISFGARYILEAPVGTPRLRGSSGGSVRSI